MNKKILVIWSGISRVSVTAAIEEFNEKAISRIEGNNIWYLEICQAKDNFQTTLNKIHQKKPGKIY